MPLIEICTEVLRRHKSQAKERPRGRARRRDVYAHSSLDDQTKALDRWAVLVAG